MGTVMEAYQGLLLTMEETLALINKMTLLAGAKEEFLVADDVEGLDDALEKEEELVMALQEKEEERISKTDELASALGIFRSGLRLKDLVDLIDDPVCRQRLTDAGDKLSEAVEGLSSGNAKVKELLQHQIDYTDFMLNLLVSPKSKMYSYDMQGNMEENNQEQSLLEYHA